ncbi:MAG: hydrogenase formation protein HypD [Myxococcota bacterium]
MQHQAEYRDAGHAQRLSDAIARAASRPHTLMEVCGGQTHSIMRFGLEQLLPPEVELVHGPGCPVCVTPIGIIDQAVALARRPDVIMTSFGDMLRVPGTQGSLFSARAEGGDVRIVYSPLDALTLAAEHPDRQVVFFSVGFETTAPTAAMAAHQARQRGLRNFSLLASHVLVPPAMEAILSEPSRRIQGFLAAGHVCTIMGTSEYLPIAERHRVPIVVTGFEPVDILKGVLHCVEQLERGEAQVTNAYPRVVRDEGNPHARAITEEVVEPVDRDWRGSGVIPKSGYGLRDAYADYDAERRFELGAPAPEPPSECIAGLVLQGLEKPPACPAFGKGCTPSTPLGAPMVSSEGACAAYYRYRRSQQVSS